MKTSNKAIVTSLLLLGMASGAVAGPYTIDDNGADRFIGEGTDANGNVLGDRFGAPQYEVFGMDVSNDASTLFVTVHTNFDQSQNASFDFGDLFIDTDGWSPDGTAGSQYADDNDSNQGNWDYAVDVSSLVGGFADLIGLGGSTLLNSSDVITGPDNTRENQEVAYLSGGSLAGSAGLTVDPGTSLSFQIALADLGLSSQGSTEIGLRWTMTCANDIVEGAANVPEPGTLALLSLGLLGLGLRKRVKS